MENVVSWEMRRYRDSSFHDDLLQEVHLKLLLKLGCFDATRGTSYKAYVRRLVRSAIVSFLRREKQQSKNIVVDVDVDDISVLSSAEEAERMERFLARLDATQRRAVVMRVEGNDYREIAKELGVSVGRAHKMLGQIATLYKEAA